MKTMKTIAAALLAAFAVSTAAEAVTAEFLKSDVLSSSAAVTPGRWNGNFAKCKKYCEDNGVPFIACWSNGDACGHCIAFERAAMQSGFRSWMKTTGIVFWFGCPSNGYKLDQSTGSALNWARAYEGRLSYTSGGPQSGFPFIRIYWPKGKVDISTVGDTMRGGFATSAANSVAKMKSYINNALKVGKTGGWSAEPVVVVPKYLGGEFAASMAATETSKMELETGLTTKFDVTLTRTNAVAAASVATNYVSVAEATAAAASTASVASLSAASAPVALAAAAPIEVLWKSNETVRTISVPVSKAGTGDVTVSILDADKTTVKGILTIPRVPAQPATTSNPYWIGERTAETLKAGEWTMDLDAALARAKAQSGDAWTLVEFTGALWCPWCRGFEEYVFEKDAFKKFTEEKNISLVCLDNVRRFSAADSFSDSVNPKSVSAGPYGAAPTLLRADIGTAGNSTASGLSYITRHMVSSEDAEKKLQENHDLGYFGGKYATPDAYRTGYPTVILVNKAGNVAGRFRYQYDPNRDSEARYPFDLGENMARFEKLIEKASFDSERDRYATTTQAKLSVGGSADADLDVNISKKCYILKGVREGKVEFTIPAEFASEYAGTLKLYRLDPVTVVRKNADLAVVKTEESVMPTALETGALDEAAGVVRMVREFKADDAATYIVEVAGFTDASTALYAEKGLDANVTVTTTEVVEPSEESRSYTPAANSVAFTTVEGAIYVLEGAWGDLTEHFTLREDGRWTAKATGRAILPVTPGAKVTYQIWNTGKVGFAVGVATVAESVGRYEVAVARTGGASGVAKFKVDFEAALKSDGETRFSDEERGTIFAASGWDLADGYEFEWKDGESGTKTLAVEIVDNEYADGTVYLDFTGAVSGGDALADEDLAAFRLAIKDNDRLLPGKLSIVAVEPAFTKSMTVTAKENSTITFNVARTGGAGGEFNATLKASKGTLGATELSWPSRDADPRPVTLTLPRASEASKVTVTLAAADSATKLDSSAKKLTVVVVPENVPEFAAPTLAVDAYLNVKVADGAFKVAAKEGTYSDAARLTAKKASGSLPAGLTVKFDADAKALVVGGVPTKKGSGTAVYQISEGAVAGTTVSVTATVVDPATGAAATSSGGSAVAANAYLAASHAYNDVMVTDADKHLVGLLTLTVPKGGKPSAKYRSVYGTVSLAAKSWDSFDPSTGAAGATLVGTTAKTASYKLTLSAGADGAAEFALTDPVAEEKGATPLTVADAEEAWSKAKPATDYRGYYTVSLPGVGSYSAKNEKSATKAVGANAPLATGDGYLTLKMNTDAAVNAGKFAFAGMLPNGKAVSGSGVVAALDSDVARDGSGKYWGVVPFLSVSDADVFGGAIRLRPKAEYDPGDWSGMNVVDGVIAGCVEGGYCSYSNVRRVGYAYEEAKPYWRHVEAKSPSASYAVEFDAFGAYYDAKENLASLVLETFEADPAVLTFYSLGLGNVAASKYGAATAWDHSKTGVKFTTTVNAKTGAVTANVVALSTTANGNSLTLSYAAATGILSGKYKLPTENGGVTVTWKGVMLPGFGDGDCECGVGGEEAKDCPFISGAAWFDDNASYYYGTASKSKALTVRRSVPVSVSKTEAGDKYAGR